MRANKQLSLDLERPSWGGKRKGAGRKRSPESGVTHRQRPEQNPRHPVHATLRVGRAVGNLRTQRKFKVIKAAIRAARERLGARIIHYSVQANHIHFILEAESREALMRALKGLSIRVARRLNQHLERSGTVFEDRYHARALATPREVRNALAYVLLNSRHHDPKPGRAQRLDPCASGAHFDGWSRRCPHEPDDDPAVVPRLCWLLRIGWQRHGPISPDFVPG